MKIITIPHPTLTSELPDLPDDVDEIVLTHPAPAEVLQWAIEQSPSVTLVAQSSSDIDDDTLESISELIEHDSPIEYVASVATEGDLALIGWDDSDEQHTALQAILDADVRCLDMTDGYQELVLDSRIDVDEIVARVTSEVLKIVRAEMSDMLRSRRYRSSGPKV